MSPPTPPGAQTFGGGQPVPSPEEIDWTHQRAGRGRDRLHHFLGLDADDASPGSHTHDGKNSLRVKASNIDGLDAAIDTAVEMDIEGIDARLDLLELRLQGVVPSLVVVGSGSASVADDGTVTFAGCSSVSLNDIFYAGEGTYEVYVSADTSASSSLVTRLRKAGVDTSSADHAYVAIYGSLAAGPSRASTTIATGFALWRHTTAGTNGISRGRATLFGPGLASSSFFYTLESVLAANGDRFLWSEAGSRSTPAGGFDGLTLVPSAGTITGTIKVVKVA